MPAVVRDGQNLLVPGPYPVGTDIEVTVQNDRLGFRPRWTVRVIHGLELPAGGCFLGVASATRLGEEELEPLRR